MNKHRKSSKKARQSKLDTLFLRADRLWEKGKLRSALRLFLAGAKAGDTSAQVNIGYFYDVGVGVHRNRSKALYWYNRAYRRGEAHAANNIATIWRDDGKPQRALAWFRRAVKLGDESAYLEIAKHYLKIENNPEKAIPCLRRVLQAYWVTEWDVQQAKRLLKKLKADR